MDRPDQQPVRRRVNAYGQGATLRGELVTAAAELLTEASAGRAVTLRAIARRAGVAAPSVYRHFADRDAVLAAVVEGAFADLAEAARAAADRTRAAGGDPASVVRAVCRAHLDFAAANPGRYRVLFERAPANVEAGAPTHPAGIEAFEVLVTALQQAVDDGSSTSADPREDAALLFAALHGLVALPPATPGFPWPDPGRLADLAVTSVAHLRP